MSHAGNGVSPGRGTPSRGTDTSETRGTDTSETSSHDTNTSCGSVSVTPAGGSGGGSGRGIDNSSSRSQKQSSSQHPQQSASPQRNMTNTKATHAKVMADPESLEHSGDRPPQPQLKIRTQPSIHRAKRAVRQLGPRWRNMLQEVRTAMSLRKKYSSQPDVSVEEQEEQDKNKQIAALILAMTGYRAGDGSIRRLLEGRSCATRLKARYVRVAAWTTVYITNTNWFTALIMGIIGIAAVTVGMQTYDLDTDLQWAITNVVEPLIKWIFVVEAVLLLLSKGLRPFDYFKDPWNLFDFVIVVSSFLPIGASQVTTLRLLRLLRLLKLVKVLPKLRRLITGLANSLSSIGYISLLLGLLFYLFAVLGVIMFSSTDPFYFGNLHTALITLWQSATGDDWSDHMYTSMFGCDAPQSTDPAYNSAATEDVACGEAAGLVWPAAYFLSFQILAGLMLLNLFVAAILMSVQEAATEISGEVLSIILVNGERLQSHHSVLHGNTCDPSVTFRIGRTMLSSRQLKHTVKPVWNQQFDFFPLQELRSRTLSMTVFDRKKDPIGDFHFNIDAIDAGHEVSFTVELDNVKTGWITLKMWKHWEGEGASEYGSQADRLVHKCEAASELIEEMEDLMKVIAKSKHSSGAKWKARAEALKSRVVVKLASFGSRATRGVRSPSRFAQAMRQAAADSPHTRASPIDEDIAAQAYTASPAATTNSNVLSEPTYVMRRPAAGQAATVSTADTGTAWWEPADAQAGAADSPSAGSHGTGSSRHMPGRIPSFNPESPAISPATGASSFWSQRGGNEVHATRSSNASVDFSA